MKQLTEIVAQMGEEKAPGRENRINDIKINIIPDEDPDVSYLEQEDFADRRSEYGRGGFGFVGVQAEAEIHVPFGAQWSEDNWVVHRISSAGLWGIESDSDSEYFKEVAREELDQLKDQLGALNVDLSNFDELAEGAINRL